MLSSRSFVDKCIVRHDVKGLGKLGNLLLRTNSDAFLEWLPTFENRASAFYFRDRGFDSFCGEMACSKKYGLPVQNVLASEKNFSRMLFSFIELPK